MYPIDCYDVANQDKLEAVKYYVDVNKNFLKGFSAKDYDAFCEFMKNQGKDVMIQISEATDMQSLDALVSQIDAKLPYANELKGKTFEQKLQVVYRKMAKVVALSGADFDRKTSLKKQRILAELYDEVVELCNKYRDAVNNRRYMRQTLENPEALNRLYAGKGQDKETFISNLRKLADETSAQTKQARAVAFGAIRDYNVQEVACRMAQENAMLLAK